MLAVISLLERNILHLRLLRSRISVSHAFDDLYAVILPFHKAIGHVVVKIIKNLIAPISEHEKQSLKFPKSTSTNSTLPTRE